MTLLEIVILGYTINFIVIGLLIALYSISLITLSATNYFELAKFEQIFGAKKSRIDFLLLNIKSWKRYDFSVFFPFAKLLELYEVFQVSLKFGIIEGILYRVELRLQKLEDLYDEEKSDKN